MICPKCRRELYNGAIVCPYCGTKISGGSGKYTPPKPPIDPSAKNQNGGVGFAIASMSCGIVAILLSCCIPWLAIVCAIVGVILGYVSLAGEKAGKGMAIAGVVCSIVALVPVVITIIGGVAMFGALSELGSMAL